MAADGIRLRLEFEGCVGSGSGAQQVFIRQWFQPHAECKTIADVAKQVAQEFQLQTPDIWLSLRGFAMARTSPVTLLRDGDIVVVTASSSLQLAGTALDLRLASVGSPEHTIQALGYIPQGTHLVPAVTGAGLVGRDGQAGGPNSIAQPGNRLQLAAYNPEAAAKHAEASGTPQVAKKPSKRKAEILCQAAEDIDAEKKRRNKKVKPAPGIRGLAEPKEKETEEMTKNKGGKKEEKRQLNAAALEAKKKLKTENAKKEAKATADIKERAISTSEEEDSDSKSDSDSEEEAAKAAAEKASKSPAKRRRIGPDGLPRASRNALRKQTKRRLIRDGILPRPPSSTKARARALHAAATASPFNPEGVSAAGLPKRGDVVPADLNTKRFVATGHVRFNDTDDEGSLEDPAAGVAAAAAPEEAVTSTRATEEPRQHQNQHSWDYSRQQAPNNPGPSRVSREVPRPQPTAFLSHPNLPKSTVAYDALTKVQGMPACGATVAYKLLEIDASFCPQISPWRSGLVTGVDAATSSVTIVPWPDLMRHPVTGHRVVTTASHSPSEEQDADEEEEEEEEEGPPSSYDERGILNIPIDSLADLRLIPSDLPGPPAQQHSPAPPSQTGAPASAPEEGAPGSLSAAARPASAPEEAAPRASSAAAEGKAGTPGKDPGQSVPAAAQKLLKAVPRALQIQRAASPAGTPPVAPRPAATSTPTQSTLAGAANHMIAGHSQPTERSQFPAAPRASATSSEKPTQGTPARAVQPVMVGQSRPTWDGQSPQATLRLTPGGPPVRFARLRSSSGGRTPNNPRVEFANTMTRDLQVGPPAAKKVPGPVRGVSALPASQSRRSIESPQQESAQPSQSRTGAGEESRAERAPQAAGANLPAHTTEAAKKTVLPGFVAASKGVATGAAPGLVMGNGNHVGNGEVLSEKGGGVGNQDADRGEQVNGSAAQKEGAGGGVQDADRGEEVAPKAMTPGAVKPRPGVRANSVGAFLARLRADG